MVFVVVITVVAPIAAKVLRVIICSVWASLFRKARRYTTSKLTTINTTSKNYQVHYCRQLDHTYKKQSAGGRRPRKLKGHVRAFHAGEEGASD